MMHLLGLLLPALIPSWRFFKSVEPSPRVQWAAEDGVWHAFRPRPAHVSVAQMMGLLFWNPDWNDYLYVVSLAERMVVAPSDHSEAEIYRRVQAEAMRCGVTDGRVQYRLIFLSREEKGLVEEELYRADPIPVRA